LIALAVCGVAVATTAKKPVRPAPAKGKPFKIGVIEDRSGPSKAFSQETVKGLIVAAKGLNSGRLFNLSYVKGKKMSGILGRPIQLVRADSTGDPNLSLTQTRKLISQGVDAIISTVASGETLNDRVACAESKTVCIGPWHALAALTQGADGQWMFTMAPPFQMQATVIARAIKASKCESVAIVQDDTAVTSLQVSITGPALEAAGVDVKDKVVIPSGSLDMSAQIAKLRQSRPCAVLNLVNPANDDATFLRAYAAARIGARVFGLGGIVSSPEVWKLAGDAINGVVAVDVISPNNPYARQFKTYYAQQQGKDAPYLSVHVQGLSALTFLKWGIEKAKTSKGPELKAALETMTKIPSAVGHYGYTQTWTASDHNGANIRAIVVLEFANGSPSKLWKTWQPQ
jgi:ABC-type branched-subunit amino acid transport system substrate-binding protein